MSPWVTFPIQPITTSFQPLLLVTSATPINDICLLKNCLQEAILPYDLAGFFSNDLMPMISGKTENSKEPVGVLLHHSLRLGGLRLGRSNILNVSSISAPVLPLSWPHEVMRWPTLDSCSYTECKDHLSRVWKPRDWLREIQKILEKGEEPVYVCEFFHKTRPLF